MYIIFVAVHMIALGIALYYVFRQYHVIKYMELVKITEVDENDPEVPVQHAIKLIGEAHHGMEMYDDGDEVPGSLYDSDEVITALSNKLSDPELEFKLDIITALSNKLSDPELEFKLDIILHKGKGFIGAIGGLPNASIYIDRPDSPERPMNEVHYRIIDGGKKAYLSTHEPGSSDRKFQVVDCTAISGKRFEDYFKKRLFDVYRPSKKNFNKVFL